MIKLVPAVLLMGAALPAPAISLWEAGRLDYADGNAEVAAFVNGPVNTQLQVVLCSKSEAVKYRLSLLLPQFFEQSMVFETVLECDGRQIPAYAELNGNSLEFTADDELYLALTHSPNLTITFDPEDAELLQLPPVIDLPMLGADEVMGRVAAECTLLSTEDNFQTRPGLLAAILWPQRGFNPDNLGDIDELCTKPAPSGYYFDLNDGCRLALDRFYQREGLGPLSFLHQLFFDENGPYMKYQTLWNDALRSLPVGPQVERGEADHREWYLSLFTLAGRRNVLDLPHSFFAVRQHTEDPTTLLYDIDNRYEMEMLKYVSVLMRRLQGSYQGLQQVEQALSAWAEFYRSLSYFQPYAVEALALRPLIYREMLLRIWRVAGRPGGVVFLPQNSFRQGSGWRTSTGEALERKCAYFEGMRGDQFFAADNECLTAIRAELHLKGLISERYQAVTAAWHDFMDAWRDSPYASDDFEAGVAEDLQSDFALTMLTASRIYGFGEYFLLRECISSRDSDICAFEKERALSSLSHELGNRVNAVARVSRADARALLLLNEKWDVYQQALADYVADLSRRGLLPDWQASLVQGIAAVLQTEVVINAPYYREELPDVTLDGDDEDYPVLDLEDLEQSALDEARQRKEKRQDADSPEFEAEPDPEPEPAPEAEPQPQPEPDDETAAEPQPSPDGALEPYEPAEAADAQG